MDYKLKLKNLINRQEFKSAEELAEKLDLIDQFIAILSHPKHSKHLASLLKRYKGNEDNVPPSLLKIMKTRHLNYVTGSSVEGQAEIRLIGDKRLLACLAERLYLKKQINESLSIIKRHKLEEYIHDSEVKKGLGRKYTYVENEYLSNDGFCKIIRPGRKYYIQASFYCIEGFRHKQRAG